MKAFSWTVGSSAPTHTSTCPIEAGEDRIDSGEIGAIGRRSRSHSPDAAHDTGGANPSITPSLPTKRNKSRRKSKTPRQRELLTMAQLPASTLRPMTKYGAFVKAARAAAPIRKWNRKAVEKWIAGPQLEVSWPANDACGTAYDPDPEIRSHMRAILKDSVEAMGHVLA